MINLSHYKIIRPEKIVWRLEGEKGPKIDPLSFIKSKTLISFLQTIDETLTRQNISWEYKEHSLEDFILWLEFYTEKMTELGYSVIASEDWYKKHRELGKKIESIFFYRQEKLICSGIFLIEENQKATFAFKASERIELAKKDNASIGSVIDYFFIREMLKRGFPIISAGKSRNAFGVFNTSGYLEYKLRFGYVPQPSSNDLILSEVPLDDSGVVLFYGIRENNFSLFAFKPKGKEINFSAQRFATEEIPFEIIEY